jgi:hypothetical protein
MIAEVLPAVLRIKLSGEVTRCEREAAFSPMWDALGDWQGQQKIRAAHPDDRHCQLLSNNCNACLTCPFSPYNEEGGKERLLADENSELYGQVIELQEAVQWGVENKMELTSTETMALDMFEREHGYLMAEYQAKITAVELSKIFRSQES